MFPDPVIGPGLWAVSRIGENIRNRRILNAHTEPRLDPSGAAEPDRDLIVLDDHRNGTAPLAVPEHALKLSRVFFDVDVLERNVPPPIVVTGGLRVGSGVFAEDVDHEPLSHQGRACV